MGLGWKIGRGEFYFFFVVIIDIICIFLGAFFLSFMEDVSDDGDELLRNSKHAQNNCSHTFIFKFFVLPSTQ